MVAYECLFAVIQWQLFIPELLKEENTPNPPAPLCRLVLLFQLLVCVSVSVCEQNYLTEGLLALRAAAVEGGGAVHTVSRSHTHTRINIKTLSNQQPQRLILCVCLCVCLCF